MSTILNGQRTPVTILTGFLGAGKTTLLNRILQGDHGLRVAVLVNDFGAINIDSELVVGIEGETISLSNGCICCTIRDDLLMAVVQTMSRPDKPEYILIEASGVSDPAAIAMTFLLPEVRPLIQLDGVITVVDAEQVTDPNEFDDLIYDQIYAADIVLLNKVDLVDEATRASVEEWVRSIVPKARILETVHADAPLELLLGVGRYQVDPDLDTISRHDPSHFNHDHDHDHDHDHKRHHDHGVEFSTWSFVSDKLLALDRFRAAFKELPTSVFRAKGIVALTDVPDRRAVFQLVGRRVSLTVGEPWGDDTPRTQLVFIGTPGGLDEAVLAPLLDSTLADGAARSGASVNEQWIRPR
jgi:G3E family GTPase